MRLSDLLRMDAMDANGEPIGQVDDVRMRIEGEELGVGRARWIVDSLLVGRGALGRRLGYDNVTEQGPRIVAALMRRLSRSARLLRWDQISQIEDTHIRASAAGDELPHPSEDTEREP